MQMSRIDRLRHTYEGALPVKIVASLGMSAVLLGGCTETPYHEVVVGRHETIDDIGYKECGPSFLSITVQARRNHIRMFNDLNEDKVHPGQRIKIPDSLCYDTGDKVRQDT